MDPPKVRFDPEDFLAPSYWDRLNRSSSEYKTQRGTFAGLTNKMRETRIDAKEWIKAPEFVPKTKFMNPQVTNDTGTVYFNQPSSYLNYATPHSMLTTSLSTPQYAYVQPVGNNYSAFVTSINADLNGQISAVILKKKRRRRRRNKNNTGSVYPEEAENDIPSDPVCSKGSSILKPADIIKKKPKKSLRKSSLSKSSSLPTLTMEEFKAIPCDMMRSYYNIVISD
ncbi:unnamed protein product [Bursaphelenchus okinawaensis]|uniref:Uncharacterized protein n=1 Tax=Bursaphelenchus okinawaensis TaxID=465554 RepID=A0A811L0I8_9BILA|nr:unnamed protein product [Bursaphelenchus okinawaensis]CAG9115235.1 unnamed protein product [Bursaphelenchus okinawaensis]